MTRGLSLHIGLNGVDPAHYRDGNGQPWKGKLAACENDARDIEQLAQSRGFESSKLLTSDATADAILTAIDEAAKRLRRGDIFFLSYSGHGGQVPDLHEDDEDGADETWVAYDRQIVDDELYVHWRGFRPGVRIVVLSDSCYGGAITITRGFDDLDGVPDLAPTRDAAAAQSPVYRTIPIDVRQATYHINRELYDGYQRDLPSTTTSEMKIGATVIAFLACQDNQLASDGRTNGLFTENLIAVWGGGAWKGGHRAFHRAIRSRMPGTQQPNLKVVGAENHDFEREDPFTVGRTSGAA